ncbi:hypothetical protein Tco_1506906 [Tanacetum coccineum]
MNNLRSSILLGISPWTNAVPFLPSSKLSTYLSSIRYIWEHELVLQELVSPRLFCSDMVYLHDVIVNPGSIAWVQQDHEAATHREVIYPRVAAESHMDADGTLNVWEEDVGLWLVYYGTAWKPFTQKKALDLIFKLDETVVGCILDILRQRDCLDQFSEAPWVVPTFAVIEGEKEILLDVVGTSGCHYEVLQSFQVERIEQGNE